jgi:hypothetical protein
MSVPNKKVHVELLTEEDLKKVAWTNSGGSPDTLSLSDSRGLPMHWDQLDKRSRNGWVIEGDKNDPSSLRARHWCESLLCFEIALLMEP